MRPVSACPASCGAPGNIPAGVVYDEMMSHIDCWATLATMVGLTPPPHGAWKDNDGKPIYFDSIDNSAYILGKAKHSARTSWIYIDGETLAACAPTSATIPRTQMSTSPGNTSSPPRTPGSARSRISGAIGSVYNLTMDPFEKYDMTFNGAVEHAHADHLAGPAMPAMTMAGLCR